MGTNVPVIVMGDALGYINVKGGVVVVAVTEDIMRNTTKKMLLYTFPMFEDRNTCRSHRQHPGVGSPTKLCTQ